MPKSAKPTKSSKSSGKSSARPSKRKSAATNASGGSAPSIMGSNKQLITKLIKDSQKENSSGQKAKPLSKRFSSVMKQQSKKKQGHFSLFGWGEKYHLESDPSMYTKEMLRKRKLLRNEQALQLKLDQFINDVYQLENDQCSREEYYRVHELITKALHSNIKQEEMQKLAEEDWKKDADVNSEFLSRDKLQDGIFELVDLWTTKVELHEYCLFLDTLKIKLRHPGSYDQQAYNVLF